MKEWATFYAVIIIIMFFCMPMLKRIDELSGKVDKLQKTLDEIKKTLYVEVDE